MNSLENWLNCAWDSITFSSQFIIKQSYNHIIYFHYNNTLYQYLHSSYVWYKISDTIEFSDLEIVCLTLMRSENLMVFKGWFHSDVFFILFYHSDSIAIFNWILFQVSFQWNCANRNCWQHQVMFVLWIQ